jgi:flagellar assembly protein FliH
VKSLSDDKKKQNGWSSLTPENLDVYHTQEFEDAQNIIGQEDDFKELNSFGGVSDTSFEPIVEGQAFEGFEDVQPEETEDESPSGDGEESRIDAVSLIVEQEKEIAYKKGFEEGKAIGREEGKRDFEKENIDLREEAKSQGFEEGKSSGFETGRVEALEEGKKEFESKLDLMNELLNSMNDSWRSVVDKYEDIIVELSLNIAKKVLYSNLTLDADFVKLSIKEALKEIPDPVDVTIGVNPDDYNIIEMIKEDFFQRFEDLKNITIISDPTIGRGGCRIDSESGGITQTIENRLRYIEDELLQKGIKKNF